MSANALFGRYWPAESPIHRLDPRTKVLGTLVLVVALFAAQGPWGLAACALFILALVPLARIPLGQALRSIAPLSFIVVLTALFNLLFVQGGQVYVDWGWLRISHDGAMLALFVAVRLALLLLAGSLLTLTTTSMDITEAFERLLTPLARFGLPAHEFAFVLGTALRFLPQFAEEFQRIRAAQLARGAKLATSPLRTGSAAVSSLLVPLFASVFRHADTLSAAMEARCYHGAQGRTRLNPLRFQGRDAVAAVALAALLAAVIILNILL